MIARFMFFYKPGVTVRAKELLLTNLIPIKRSPAFSAIQCLEGGLLQTGLVAVVIGELSVRQAPIPTSNATCFLVPDVDARGNTVMHGFILVPFRSRTSSKGVCEGTVLSCAGGACM